MSPRAAALTLLALAAAMPAVEVGSRSPARDTGGPEWVLPQRHRLLLRVDLRGHTPTRSVAAVDVDLGAQLAASGEAGALDPATVEVVGYDGRGQPFVFDRAATGPDRFPLPWHAEALYPLSRTTLSFLVPDPSVARYAVYFDTVGSPRADPHRYSGLVGDGDFFTEGYGRREIAPNAFDDMADLDGDGDLDLVKGGTEPALRVFECVGGARYVDRGWLTSAGE